MDKQQSRLIPAHRWNDFHPWPPKGGLKYLIFHEKTNGFDKVVKRCGRRVLIDEAKFFQWIESNANHGSKPCREGKERRP